MHHEAIQEREKARDRAAWLRVSALQATLANIHRGKGSRTYRADDFMPRERRPLTPEEFHARMSAWAVSHNATVQA